MGSKSGLLLMTVTFVAFSMTGCSADDADVDDPTGSESQAQSFGCSDNGSGELCLSINGARLHVDSFEVMFTPGRPLCRFHSEIHIHRPNQPMQVLKKFIYPGCQTEPDVIFQKYDQIPHDYPNGTRVCATFWKDGNTYVDAACNRIYTR